MNSMTGFGRAVVCDNGRELSIEIKSVNHRFLDINIRIPRILMFLEDYLRNIIKSRLSRGRIDVFINFSTVSEDDKDIQIDIQLIKSYLTAFSDIHNQTGIDNDIAMSNILRIPDAIKIKENELNEEELKNLIKNAAGTALDNLIKMRSAEGAGLIKDILMRLSNISELAEKLEKFENTVTAELREKLNKRISELSELNIDETRIMQEIVFYADKQDITEEIVRIKTHVANFEKTAEKNTSGKQLDFIVQELNREFNTIASKSANIEVTNLAIEGKSLVEKIREQVQNIE